MLTVLCAAPGAHLPAKGLSELLGAVLGSEQLWERRDADTTVAAIRLLEDGFCRLATVEPDAAMERLPRAVHTLVPQLAMAHENVRYAAGMCLKNIINEFVSEAAVDAALAGGSGGKQPSPLHSVLAALESSLGPHYQDAWSGCLPGEVRGCKRVAVAMRAAEQPIPHRRAGTCLQLLPLAGADRMLLDVCPAWPLLQCARR